MVRNRAEADRKAGRQEGRQAAGRTPDPWRVEGAGWRLGGHRGLCWVWSALWWPEDLRRQRRGLLSLFSAAPLLRLWGGRWWEWGKKGFLGAGCFQLLKTRWQRTPCSPSFRDRPSQDGSGGHSAGRPLQPDFLGGKSCLSLAAGKPRLGTHLVEAGMLEGAPWAQGDRSLLALRSSPPEFPTWCVRARERETSSPHSQRTKTRRLNPWCQWCLSPGQPGWNTPLCDRVAVGGGLAVGWEPRSRATGWGWGC